MSGTRIPESPWEEAGSDVLTIDGVTWPGIAFVTVTRANAWDEKKAKGEHQGERDFTGVQPAKVTITLKVSYLADRNRVDSELLPKIDPDPQGKTKATSHTINHSACASRKVSAITVDSVSGWDRTSFDEATLTINATEYRPKASVNATGKAKGGPSATPQQQLDLQCQLWRGEYEAQAALAMAAYKAGNLIDCEIASTRAQVAENRMKSHGCKNCPPTKGSKP